MAEEKKVPFGGVPPGRDPAAFPGPFLLVLRPDINVGYGPMPFAGSGQ